MKSEHIWYNLDNQANIYPAVSDKKNTNVFRLSCTLKGMVSPNSLQKAVDNTLSSFSYYQMILRRGLFWFYLEPTEQQPEVLMESERPCNEIFHMQIKDLLFKVTYFNNRINLEVFHALSDGGGALEFFKAIIHNYLILIHKEDLKNISPVLERKAVPASQAEDSFKRYYTQGDKDGSSGKKAFLLSGLTLAQNDVQIISVKMSTKAILALAKSKSATLTGYITALNIMAISEEMMSKRHIDRDVAVNVPVDLRGMFPSQTFRNFFSVVKVRYSFGSSPNDFDSVLKSISEQLKEKINEKNLVKTLNYNVSVQENYFSRAVPLFIKNRILKLAYSQKESTATTTVSNVGRVVMQPELVPYIEDFQCLLNPTSIHKIKLCVTSFEDNLIMNFTSNIAETSLQKYFVRHLTSNDIKVTITTNGEESYETL